MPWWPVTSRRVPLTSRPKYPVLLPAPAMCRGDFPVIASSTASRSSLEQSAMKVPLRQGTVFLTALEHRNALAWIEVQRGVECHLDGLELQQLGVAELNRHLRQFFQADAVFTGNAAAEFHAALENAGPEGLGAADLLGLTGIEQYQRVQVAVPGVKHIGNAQATLSCHVADLGKHLRHVPAWNGAVHAVVVRRQSTDSGEGRFATTPQPLPGGAVPCHFDAAGPRSLQQRAHRSALLCDFCLVAVKFA